MVCLTLAPRGEKWVYFPALNDAPLKDRSIGLDPRVASTFGINPMLRPLNGASFDAEKWTHFSARGARGLRTETIANVDERSQSPKPFTAPDTQNPITSFTGGRDLVRGEQAVGPIGRHLVRARMGHPHQCRSRSFHASLPVVQGEPTSRG